MSFLPAAAAIAGPIIQGIGQFKASQANAAALDAQAWEEQQAAVQQEADLRMQAREAIGQQLASQFSGGIEGGTGSTLDYLRESQINAALDVLRIRREGTVKAQTLKKQASATRTQGYFQLASSLLNAGSASAGDWAAPRAIASGAGG